MAQLVEHWTSSQANFSAACPVWTHAETTSQINNIILLVNFALLTITVVVSNEMLSCSIGTAVIDLSISELLISELLISELLISELLISELLISELLISELLIYRLVSY